MKIRTLGSIAAAMAVTVFFSGGLACAADSAPMTPEYAAKQENFRKQHEQRITPDKRKAASENLKAERLKVYQAKQAKQASEGKLPGTHPKPEKKDNK